MSIRAADFVIEIGPGHGALTKPLVARAHHVRAVELDPFLADKLRRRFGGAAEVETGDFLHSDLPLRPYKVVGNVPYSLTTAIVRKVIEDRSPPEDAWLIVQREFAWRLCGRPYTNETLWSLQLKPCWHIEIVDRLRRTDFDPPPGVDSVMLWLARRGRPLLTDRAATLYHHIVEAAYRNGAASIRQAVRPWLSKAQVQRLARDLRFAGDSAATTLGFEQWLGIVRFVARLSPTEGMTTRRNGA
jgi:23S rRNA (adenine-N6)-dimethyltransferase